MTLINISRKPRKVEIWLIYGNQAINLQKWCPRIKYVGTQFSIYQSLYSVRARVASGSGEGAAGEGGAVLDPKITVSLHYRLGLLPACLLTTRTTSATSIHTYICDDGAVKRTTTHTL